LVEIAATESEVSTEMTLATAMTASVRRSPDDPTR
jgi:hypothetical protein